MSNDLVPSSGQLPIPFTGPKWLKRFNQFVDDLDALVEYYNELQETRRMTGGAIPNVEDVREKHERQKKLIDDCRAGRRLYDRNGEDDLRYDDEGDLKIEYATARLCWMLDRGWPDHTKRFERHENPEQAAAEWCETLVEFVLARDTTAVELESVIVRLIDAGKPFPPQIQDVMPVLKAEQEAWEPRKNAIRHVDMIYQWLIKEIPEAEAAAEKRKAEEEAKAARYRAETEAFIARQKIQAEADAACKQAEAWEAEEKDHAEFLDHGRRFAAYPLEDSLKEMGRVLGGKMDDFLMFISGAIGLFEARREMRAWQRDSERELEREAGTSMRPSSKRRRRVEAKPTKLAAARTEQITGEQTNDTVALAACARPAAKRTQKPKGGQS
jgi:hypothetical protein